MDNSAPLALVTGGAGFIGSHLCELLLARGRRVVALDDLSTGHAANLRAVERDANFRLVVGDCRDGNLLERFLPECAEVYHLAAAVGVRRIVDAPVETIERNVGASEIVLRLSARWRCRLLLASTSEVYGAGAQDVFREDDDLIIGEPTRRRWSYAATKLLDEFLALAHHHASGLPVTIARLFNTIGPRQVDRYGMVVPTFVRQALSGRPLTVFGDGAQRRCFTHVRDAATCLVDLVERPEAEGGIYNVGADAEITILELAKRVIALCGGPSIIVFQSYLDAYGEDFTDMERRRPSQERLRAAIGHAPDTPLDAALADTIAAMRAETAREDSGAQCPGASEDNRSGSGAKTVRRP